jgi:hypothetical protein
MIANPLCYCNITFYQDFRPTQPKSCLVYLKVTGYMFRLTSEPKRVACNVETCLLPSHNGGHGDYATLSKNASDP